VSSRADRLVELLPAAGIDVLLVTGLVNVRYLTGYTGSNGLALIGPHTRTFVTDFRYVEQAAEEVERLTRRGGPPSMGGGMGGGPGMGAPMMPSPLDRIAEELRDAPRPSMRRQAPPRRAAPQDTDGDLSVGE